MLLPLAATMYKGGAAQCCTVEARARRRVVKGQNSCH